LSGVLGLQCERIDLKPQQLLPCRKSALDDVTLPRARDGCPGGGEWLEDAPATKGLAGADRGTDGRTAVNWTCPLQNGRSPSRSSL